MMILKVSHGIHSDDSSVQLDAMRQCREMLALPLPPTDDVIGAGILARIVQLVQGKARLVLG